MTHAEKTEQWRAIFAQAQAEELEESPLSPLDSPLERAKHEVALQFFKQQKRSKTPRRLALWEADDATRRAFFDHFGFERDDLFCLRHERSIKNLNGPRNNGSAIYLYSKCVHLLSDLENGELTRRWHRQDASRGGMGQTDLWRFDGDELVFVKTISWRIS